MGGALVLWVGWYAFNMGSSVHLSNVAGAHSAANSAVATTISAAAGGLAAVLLSVGRSFALGGAQSRACAIDAISLANGLLSGLVAITPGSDVLPPGAAFAVGAGSAAAYMLASALSEVFKLDDVVEAGAVHAGCGTWGCLAVGLLHPSRGLLASGSFALLGVQLVGVAVILTFAFSSALVVAYALREMELLRVSPEEEAKGLDHRFGIAANATLYDKAIRMREASAVLEANGHTVSELIEALQAIKHHIILPFNPHASDLMLEGQVDDVLSRLTIPNVSSAAASAPAEGAGRGRRPSLKLAAKLRGVGSVRDVNGAGHSHPLIGGGGAGGVRAEPAPAPAEADSNNRSPTRVRLDRVIEASRRMSESGATVKLAFADPTAEQRGGDDSFATTAPSQTTASLFGTMSHSTTGSGPPTPQCKYLAFLSHHKADGGDAARVFVDTARRIVPGGSIFLDSANLTDLRHLLVHVEESQNYILMLTRAVLERPWVLAELTRAHVCGKPMQVICAAWPGDASSPTGRTFHFPRHLDEALDEWQEYFYEASLRAKAMEESSSDEEMPGWRKLLVGSVIFQRLKLALEQQERPANSSTWTESRWDIILSRVTAGIWQRSRRSTLGALSAVFRFNQLAEAREETEQIRAGRRPHRGRPRWWSESGMPCARL